MCGKISTTHTFTYRPTAVDTDMHTAGPCEVFPKYQHVHSRHTHTCLETTKQRGERTALWNPRSYLLFTLLEFVSNAGTLLQVARTAVRFFFSRNHSSTHSSTRRHPVFEQTPAMDTCMLLSARVYHNQLNPCTPFHTNFYIERELILYHAVEDAHCNRPLSLEQREYMP